MKEKTFVNDILKLEKEYELDGSQIYLLYDNENQDTLLAVAYEESEIKEESQYYNSGFWFVCDNTKKSNIILNERKYNKKIKFPKTPKNRFEIKNKRNEYGLNSNIGDLR